MRSNEKLRDLASKMTQPGPWRVVKQRGVTPVEYNIIDGNGMWIAHLGVSPLADAKYLAAVSPDVALALLDEIGRLELEHRQNGIIISNVNEAIGRAGIHCAITFWDAIDRISAERRAALAHAERLTGIIGKLLASAHPNERDHPAMSRAWREAEATLADPGDTSLDEPEPEGVPG